MASNDPRAALLHHGTARARSDEEVAARLQVHEQRAGLHEDEQLRQLEVGFRLEPAARDVVGRRQVTDGRFLEPEKQASRHPIARAIAEGLSLGSKTIPTTCRVC
jgi:hypothetical protein